ncbi:MAG TPA: hypothetical protein VMU65_11015 [Candidatus Saccharimonadales bacterium]|nr:hypothetical protein [Candidatus Saccharimonadales bacterium]
MDSEPDLPDAERERVRHRDRKRERRMIVDNAGIKRVLPAIAEKRRRSAPVVPPQDDIN